MPVPELNESYHKARKSYGLFSVLLFLWELVGIELTEAPIENMNITFKSPQAAPFILIVLVTYFGYRFTVEWYQTDPRRRNARPSQIDFFVAHCIGVLSILFYTVQFILSYQIANELSEDLLDIALLHMVFGLLTGSVFSMFYMDYASAKRFGYKYIFRKKHYISLSVFIVIDTALFYKAISSDSFEFITIFFACSSFPILFTLGVRFYTYLTVNKKKGSVVD